MITIIITLTIKTKLGDTHQEIIRHVECLYNVYVHTVQQPTKITMDLQLSPTNAYVYFSPEVHNYYGLHETCSQVMTKHTIQVKQNTEVGVQFGSKIQQPCCQVQ